jgi:hypothetical protein
MFNKILIANRGVRAQARACQIAWHAQRAQAMSRGDHHV